MKFSTRCGIGEIRGDQALARHCYSITLQKNDQSDSCPVDELDVHDDLTKEQDEPMEDLVAVPLNDMNAEHVV